jgi:four helix bundle protein
MGNKGFRDLVVWQKAKNLAVRVHVCAKEGALGRSHQLCDEICRSAVSIPSNIAEGDERDTDREAVRFFYIAKGSLAELRTQLQIAYEAGFMKASLYENLEAECDRLGKMLGGLIRARS